MGHLEPRIVELHGNALWTAMVMQKDLDAKEAHDYFGDLQEQVKELVKNKPSLARSSDVQGRVALNVATRQMKQVIEEEMFFCGKYDVDHGLPLHQSATALVVLADDFTVSDDYEAAVKQRKKLNSDQFKQAFSSLVDGGFGAAAKITSVTSKDLDYHFHASKGELHSHSADVEATQFVGTSIIICRYIALSHHLCYFS